MKWPAVSAVVVVGYRTERCSRDRYREIRISAAVWRYSKKARGLSVCFIQINSLSGWN